MSMNLSKECLDNFTSYGRVENLQRFIGVGLTTDISELEAYVLTGNKNTKSFLDRSFDYATWGSQVAVALLRLRGKRS